MPSENSLTADVPVNTIEKPLSVTIPNDSTAGTCYIGTRASDKDQWRYSLVTDGITSSARFMRLSSNPPKTCTFNLFRLNIEFRLFVFDNESKKDEVQVDTLTLAPAEDVEIKEGKYSGKLIVKLNVEGENLNGLKAEDLKAKITYRSENQQGANIDFTTNKVDSSDKAVTGSYEHSFEISNIKVENTIGNTAELSFELNLDGVSLEDFPKDFLVEFYSKGSDENTRPFEYTQAFSFETKNPDNPDNPDPDNPDPDQPSVMYTITYNLDGGEPTGNNLDEYGTASDPIILSNPKKDGHTFKGWSGTNLTGDSNQEVTIVKGSTGARSYTANFVEIYNITYDLANGSLPQGTTNPTTYSVLSDDITLNNPTREGYTFKVWSDTGLTGDANQEVTIAKASTGARTYTANWKLNLTLTITSANDNIHENADNDKNLYKFSPTFTITPNVENGVVMTVTEKSDILEALKVNDANGTAVNSNSINQSWNNGVIALSFKDDLEGYTTYTISFGDISSVNLTYSPLSFTTYYFKGSGNSGDPYQIASATQLVLVNQFANKNFIQMNDIDLVGYTCWNALCGENSNGNPTNPFIGVYDGGNKNIKNFTIHSSEAIQYAGLFGFVNSGTIKNLTVDGFSIRGATENESLNVKYLGIIAAQIDNNSSITYCHITDSHVTNATDSSSIASGNIFEGYLYLGGICSINYGTITSCSVEKCQFKCSADNAVEVYIGGICYNNSGTITNCSLNEVIIDCSVANIQYSEYIGGICAENSGILTSCSLINSYIRGSQGNNGNLKVGGISANHKSNTDITSCDIQNSRVSGSGYKAYVGGIAGCSNLVRKISSCSVKSGSLVEGRGQQCKVGGIGGYNLAVTNSYFDGSTVKCEGYRCRIGGICGDGNVITKCYVEDSDIIETSTSSRGRVGGISGSNGKNISSCYLLNSNVKGSGNDSDDYVGGICGYLRFETSPSPVMSSCYVCEDANHSISKTNSTGEGKLGYLVGLLYKYESNPASNATIKDSFYNGTTSNLSDLVNRVGDDDSNSSTPDDYGYVTNCYGGINSLSAFSTDNSNPRAWSDGSCSDFDTTVSPPTFN